MLARNLSVLASVMFFILTTEDNIITKMTMINILRYEDEQFFYFLFPES